jgi:hypothetical protein
MLHGAVVLLVPTFAAVSLAPPVNASEADPVALISIPQVDVFTLAPLFIQAAVSA